MVGNEEDMSYEDFILSMVFYTFDMRDNKVMLEKTESIEHWLPTLLRLNHLMPITGITLWKTKKFQRMKWIIVN